LERVDFFRISFVWIDNVLYTPSPHKLIFNELGTSFVPSLTIQPSYIFFSTCRELS
jgi:hypothetical protein